MNSEHNEKPEIKIINGREYRITEILAEDPETVKKRDKIKPDVVGSRYMTPLLDRQAQSSRKAPTVNPDKLR